MKNNDPLGNNPLGQGIFSKTTSYSKASVSPEPKSFDSNSVAIAQEQKPEARNQEPETGSQELETINHKLVPRNHKPGTGFLSHSPKEKITLQISEPVNDWVDGLVRGSKKRTGQKIQKQIWVQAALELMQAVPIEWGAIESVEDLRNELEQVVKKLGKKVKGSSDLDARI
jgi:hypothetical protein